MRTVLPAVFLLLPFSIFAQTTPPPKQWDKTYGGLDSERPCSVMQKSNGDYMIAGTSKSGISGDKTQSSRGGNDYWIIITDSMGIKKWDRRFGSSVYEELVKGILTADGGYLLGGYTDAMIAEKDKSEPGRGSGDYWIVKLDSNGNKQWDKTFGGDRYDYLKDVMQTADGGYVLAGHTMSGISGDKTEASKGFSDFWVIKIDNAGNKQWDKTYGGTLFDESPSVKQTPDGEYILGGVSTSGIGGDKTSNPRGEADFWVIKIDAAGTKMWDQTYGGANHDHIEDIQRTADGGYIFAGVSNSPISGEKTEKSRSDFPGFRTYDYWVIKSDASGNKQWDKTIGGYGSDELFTVNQATDGGYILGGVTQSDTGGDKTEPRYGYSDFWIVKIGTTGTKIWDKDFGTSGSGYDYFQALAPTKEGGYVLAGSTNGEGGDKTDTSRGSTDFWIIKLAGECPRPAISANGPTTHLCPADSVVLSAPKANTYLWNTGATTKKITVRTSGNYSVTTTDSNLCTGTSSAVAISFDPCSSPSGLQTSTITNNSVKLNWKSSGCAVKYQYQWKVKTADAWTKSAVTKDTTATISGLKPGKTYLWRVRAFCRLIPDTVASAQTKGTEFTTLPGIIAGESNSAATLKSGLQAKLYPNPVKDIASLTITKATGKLQVTLIDIAGKQLWQSSKTSSTNTPIPTQNLAPGTYLVQVRDDKETVVLRMVKE